MSKGRGSRRREAKKPKGGNKPVPPRASFLPAQPAATKPPGKETSK
jgi:hypothetical protein